MAYGRVEETFWHDRKIRALSERARMFMLYLLTSPHRNRLGCFVLDPYYAAADLQWDATKVQDAIQELSDAGRIGFDEANRVVFVCKYLKHNPPENQNVVKAAVKDLRALPDTPLIGLLLDALERHSRPHFSTLIGAVETRVDDLGESVAAEEVSNGLVNHSPNGLPNRGLRLGTGTGTGEVGEKGSGEEGGDPAIWMHEDWHIFLGIEGHPIAMTPKRRQKYRAMYDEQLRGLDDPRMAWKAVLYTVTRSDYHMSDRAYQMPDSLLLNAERRDKWVQKAIAADVKSDADRRFEQKRAEVLDFLRARKAG